jgi:hypothetical protein
MKEAAERDADLQKKLYKIQQDVKSNQYTA